MRRFLRHVIEQQAVTGPADAFDGVTEGEDVVRGLALGQLDRKTRRRQSGRLTQAIETHPRLGRQQHVEREVDRDRRVCGRMRNSGDVGKDPRDNRLREGCAEARGLHAGDEHVGGQRAEQRVMQAGERLCP
jgi:hypothetical protein